MPLIKPGEEPASDQNNDYISSTPVSSAPRRSKIPNNLTPQRKFLLGMAPEITSEQTIIINTFQ